MTLIGAKSKYGSCNGNCTGCIKLNIFQRNIGILPTGSNPEKDKIKEGSVCWLAGWAVNSMAIGHRRFDSFSSYNGLWYINQNY